MSEQEHPVEQAGERRRNTTRGSVIRFQERIRADGFANTPLVQLREFQKIFSRIFDKFASEHLKVVELCDDEVRRQQFEDDYMELEQIQLNGSIQLQEQIYRAEEVIRAEQVPVVEAVTQQPIHDNFLEKIKPTIFSGQFSEWPQWRAMFDSLIHNKENITSTEKFHYLVDALDGDAKRTVKGWSIVGENYNDAYESLVRIYENSYRITMAHLEELFSMKKLDRESYEGLRAVVDTTNRVLRQLRVSGSPVEHWDHIIVYHLISRMPPRTLQSWEQAQDIRQMPNKDDVLNFLDRRARGLINATANQATQGADKVKEQKQSGAKPSSSNVQAIGQQSSSKQSGSKQNSGNIKCYKCSGPHPIYRCTDVLSKSVNDRYKIIRSLKLCQNCLTPGHESGTAHCKFDACKHCRKGEYHNSILCREFRPRVVASTSTVAETNVSSTSNALVPVNALQPPNFLQSSN